jgi:nitroimidazol reductase NimA-like FMN-containing flavoprotein (pyridoxamine 5'-phosphate oxidase superfamily)
VFDRSDVDRLLAANRYLVLATADEDGQPWATPVFFASLDPHTLCWVSSPNSRHLLVRGGNAEFGNELDMTIEV